MKRGRKPGYSTEGGDAARTKIFDYVVKFKHDNDGVSPSVRQIMFNCGMSSTSQVYHHLNRLKDGGLIRFVSGIRGIAVVGGVWRMEGDSPA